MTYDPYRRLAALILADGWGSGRMEAIIQRALKGRKNRSAQITAHIASQWVQPYPPSEASLAELIRARFSIRRRDIPLCLEPAGWSPLRFPGVPELDAPEVVADWLGITPAQLDWFADCQGRLARPGQERFAHYIQVWIPKRTGRRLLEAPRPRLKAIQRKVLHEILDQVPAHPDALGFVRGRSCRDHAARHSGEQVVVTVDIKDFFPSIPARRVHGTFRAIGYRHSVARLLTGLCTTRSPSDICAALPAAERSAYHGAHLPQGAPTSPALANLAARRLDLRLAGLARRMGVHYSRYADDLAFSGDRGLAFDHGTPLLEQVHEIIRDEGFRPNQAKTRIMRQGRPQRVTGLIVNRHINVPRAEYDRLKAILTNSLRHGPSSQNRAGHLDFRAHLDGRITWTETINPRRGARLRALFDEISWG